MYIINNKMLRRYFTTGTVITKNVKEIVFDAPNKYKKLQAQDLYWVANERAAQKTFLKSHKDVHHEYFVSENNNEEMPSLKTFYIKSFFGDTCEGPPLHAHGGLTASILDEAMGTSCWANKIQVMTKKFTTSYHLPVKLNQEIHGVAYIKSISDDGKYINTYGKLFYPGDDEKILVETTGIFKRLNKKQMEKMQTWSNHSTSMI